MTLEFIPGNLSELREEKAHTSIILQESALRL